MEEVRLFIGAGANIEARDEDQRTPLLLAVFREVIYRGRGTEVIKELIEASANIEATDKFGKTPLLTVAELLKMQTRYN